MMKNRNILAWVAVAAMTVACSNEELPLTLPDGYDEIKFTVGDNAPLTRAGELVADEGYHIYDYSVDPHSMGVFGWYNLSYDNSASSSPNKMFYDVEVTASKEGDVVSWSYADKKYWFDYATYTSFDFFACMPYDAGATLTRVNKANSDDPAPNKYVLTLPVNFSEGNGFATEETALLCNLPIHKTVAEGTIGYKMDQTLAGFKLVFELGTKMDNLRDFLIKEVKIDVNGLIYKGTVSREYTWDGSSWSHGDITWGTVQDGDKVAEESWQAVPYKDNSGVKIDEGLSEGVDMTKFYNNIVGSEYMRVTNVPVQWGNPIYLMPSQAFSPTISVKYDAVVVDEDGHDIVTRENVVSTIEFNSTNFTTYTSGTAAGMAHTNTIRIKIVPDHLYVLADADQTFGWLVMQ